MQIMADDLKIEVDVMEDEVHESEKRRLRSVLQDLKADRDQLRTKKQEMLRKVKGQMERLHNKSLSQVLSQDEQGEQEKLVTLGGKLETAIQNLRNTPSTAIDAIQRLIIN